MRRTDDMEKVLQAMRVAARRRREREFQAQVVAACALILITALLVCLCAAVKRRLTIGTELPLPAYSVSEFTGEVLK